jgi:DinB family protein
MKELEEYRKGLMEKLENMAKAFRAECLSVKDPYTPLAKDGWNVHQIAVHTRDVDKLVYGSRARRTALDDNPEFQNFNGEAYMGEHYNAKESLSELLNGFVASVQALVELLRALPVEGWSRLSRHATLGSGLTLQSWVEKDLAHIEEHLETVKNQNKK